MKREELEVHGKDCEKCGKPAQCMLYDVVGTLVESITNVHYYCNKCVKEKWK